MTEMRVATETGTRRVRVAGSPFPAPNEPPTMTVSQVACAVATARSGFDVGSIPGVCGSMAPAQRDELRAEIRAAGW